MGICTFLVGGTGILRPTADARRGLGVTVPVRGAIDRPPQVFAALGAALEVAIATRRPFGLALAQTPFAPAILIEAVAEHTSSRLIYVLTCR